MANYYLNTDGSVTKNKKQTTGKNYILNSNGTITLDDEEEKRKKEIQRQSEERRKKISEQTTNKTNKIVNDINSGKDLTELQKAYGNLSMTEQAALAKKLQEETKSQSRQLELMRQSQPVTPMYNKETIEKQTGEKLADAKYAQDYSNSILQPSAAFKDGYQVGDITKTAVSTVGDATARLVGGIANIGEGIGKSYTYTKAKILDKMGQKEKAQALRENAKGTSSAKQDIDRFTRKIGAYSVLGGKSKNLAESLGYIAGIAAISSVGGEAAGALGGTETAATVGATLSSSAATFSSSMGHGITEAYNEGANDDDAYTYGIIAGTAETATELMFGGIGKGSKAIGLSKSGIGVDDALAKKVGSIFKNQLAKNFAEYSIKASGEGVEEVVSGIIQAVGKKVTYMSEAELSQLLQDQHLLEQFVDGAVISAISSAPGLVTTTMTGQDYIQDETPMINQIQELQKAQEALPTARQVQQLPKATEVAPRAGQAIENTEVAPAATQENTYSNKLKQIATDEINKSSISSQDKTEMLNVLKGLDTVTDADIEAIRNTIQGIRESQQLETKGDYKNDQTRRQKYMQYKNDTSTYDSTAVDEVLDAIPQNRNGRRTVKQWLQAADEIGKQIANLSNEEIEKIAYKSWFDIQPSKSITQYDNVAHKPVNFQKFTSDEWVNTINKAVNEARANNEVQENAVETTLPTTEENNINNKIKAYLDKTGLSSKMSVEEFINKAEKFTLENELNMTAEQQELYNIIKDIQNRNNVKEEVVDYDNGLWYNDKGIEYSNKFYEKQLDSAITTDTPNLEKNKFYTKEFGDNFYLFKKINDGEYAKYLQVKIKGNEDIINLVEEAVKNGEFTNIQNINEIVSEFRNRDSNSDGINNSIKEQTRKNGQSSRLYREESKFNTRSNNNGSNEISNVEESIKNKESENKSGSFSMEKIKEAKNIFGTTTNFKEAGYLTLDGEYLDFSGKNQGGQPGSRTLDHRDIAEAYTDEQYSNAEKKYKNMGSATAIMQDFIDDGNIRLTHGGIDISIEPNETQYNKLYDYIEWAKKEYGELYVDLESETKNKKSLEYNAKTSTSKIIQDIKNHYNDIVVREEGKEFKQDLAKQFKELTGDTINLAGAKLAGIEVRNNMRKAGNLEGELETNPYNKEAMDIYTKYQNSQKTSSYLYHATGVDRLESIIKNGLTIGNKQNQEGVSSHKEIYLSATPELAETYANGNSVTLRINPKFYDKFENFRQDYLGGKGAYAITNNIPPEMLQIKENNKWVNLTDSKQAKQIQTTNGKITKDTQGRVFTEEQQEFFKDVSKEMLDENNNLKVLNHGSREKFTIFDRSKGGQSNGIAKVGFWFTDKAQGAINFAIETWYGKGDPQNFQVYLNLKNPKVYDTIDTSTEVEKVRKEINNKKRELTKIGEKYEFSKISIQNIIARMSYGYSVEQTLDGEGYTQEQVAAYKNDVEKYKQLREEIHSLEKQMDNMGYDDSYEQFRTDIYKMAGQTARDANIGGLGMHLDNENEVIEQYRQKLIDEGYDGIVIKNTRFDAGTMGDKNTQYVAFYPEQIKSVDNQKPTNNPDIFKEQYTQLSIEGFNNEVENNLSKENWSKYQEAKKKTSETLKKDGTKVEIAKRKFSKDFVDNGYIDLNGKTIDNAADVADTAQIFRNPKYETFRVIYMKGNTIVGQEAVSSKLPSESRPFTKNDTTAKGLYKIQNRMERLGADGYYLIHNHPTGTAKASNADINMTKVIDKKVKGFLGHVIINSGTYALIEHSDTPSFKDTLIWKDEIKIKNYKPDAVDKMMSKELWANTQIKNREDILNLAYDLKNNPNYSSLIMTDTKQIPRIVLDIPNKFLNMNLGQINGYIRNVARQNGADNAFIATQDAEIFDKMFFSNALRDCILYSVNENGDLIAKQSKTKENGSSRSIFQSTGNTAIRANEKIEDIYNSFFENKKLSNIAPRANEYNNKTIMNPTEIANTKKESMNTTPKLETKNYKPGNKQSSFVSNILNDAQFLNKDLRQEMGKDENIRYYSGITNAETLEKAYNSLTEGGEKETLNWFSKNEKNITAEDVTKGWILLKQYQDAGDYQGAVEVAKKMRQMGTTAGQAVQAYNIMARMSPEGMVYYTQAELSEAYSKMVEGKSKQWIEKNQDKFTLTPEETQTIMDIMQEVSEMEDGREKNVKLAQIQQMVSNKIPPTAGQGIRAWMRISMLFNPKTQVRNVMGNTVVLPVNATADAFSSAMDKLISKKTGVRTTGITREGIKGYGKGFRKGLFESYDDFRKGINTRNVEGNRFEISEGKSFKDKGIGKALNRIDNILSFSLDAGDRGFYEAAFTNSINNQLVLNKTNQVTQEMIDIATNEALQRTWQDNNAYTETVLSIRRNLNKLNVKGYGLGDVLIPFAKTPANLTKAIVDYSPVGLAKTLSLDAKKFNNSLNNGQYSAQLQHKFVQNLGKGMAGSLLYALGYGLAKAGIATGESDDDKDVKNFMKNSLGIGSYSIKVGDKSFSYDWAQPVATPLAIMTNYVKYSKDNPEAKAIEKAIKSLDIGSEQLLKQSFMESINTVLNGSGSTMENLSQAVLDLPARAIPTFSKQIADMVDSTQRTSFEYGEPVKSAINSVVSKIPFASRTLPTAVDTLGNDIQKYGGNNNLWNVMINPANTNKGKLSKAGEEIYNVYMQTGDTTIFPRTAPYYINSKGQKITMTSQERSKFQTTTGKYVEESLSSLIKDTDYKKLNNEEKAKIINEIVSDSYAKAKYDVLNIDSSEYTKLRETLKEINPSTYYNYKFKTNGMKKDNEKINVITNSSYTNNEKLALYENYVNSNDKNISLVKDLNINTDEYLKYKLNAGTKKAEKVSYMENTMRNVSYMNKLMLLGTEYALSSDEKDMVYNYVTGLNKTKAQKLEILSKIKGFTVSDNGTVRY